MTLQCYVPTIGEDSGAVRRSGATVLQELCTWSHQGQKCP